MMKEKKSAGLMVSPRCVCYLAKTFMQICIHVVPLTRPKTALLEDLTWIKIKLQHKNYKTGLVKKSKLKMFDLIDIKK